MMDYHKDYYKGINGIYFYRILNKIIKMGNLRKRQVKILDFGCGVGKLKTLLGDKVINYDMLPDLSEIDDWKKAKFDVLVSNQVFHFFPEKELKQFLDELYGINPDVELIVGIARANLLSEIAIFLTGERQAHEGFEIESKKIFEVLKERMDLLKYTSVFQMCDIYLMRFKQLNP